ncbi:MAG: hypothetical protein COT84_08235 [Chlamydiae bacterium CG10_big_fil_rev_8_21_14_0_10_35_9]|nr:MAG: hypothetical protein COT84_08235 [Chlamydiae bacterium CG10_big_fil_rev_8_21_14_0_10_35_9]
MFHQKFLGDLMTVAAVRSNHVQQDNHSKEASDSAIFALSTEVIKLLGEFVPTDTRGNFCRAVISLHVDKGLAYFLKASKFLDGIKQRQENLETVGNSMTSWIPDSNLAILKLCVGIENFPMAFLWGKRLELHADTFPDERIKSFIFKEVIHAFLTSAEKMAGGKESIQMKASFIKEAEKISEKIPNEKMQREVKNALFQFKRNLPNIGK